MDEVIKMLPRYRVPVVKKKQNNGGKKRKTHEEYVEELKVKNPTVLPLEKYINYKTKIKHKCVLHNIIWQITPNNALRGDGCEQCKYEKFSNKRRKAHEEYVNELKIKNSKLTPIDNYIDCKTPITHLCNNGHNIKIAPSNVLHGEGCKLCHIDNLSKLFKMTHEEYLFRLDEIQSTVVPIENYNGMHCKIKHTDINCKHIWEVAPTHVLEGKGCPTCKRLNASEKRMKTNEQFLNAFYKNPNSKDVTILSPYNGIHNKIKCECKICGYVWNPTADALLKFCGCPKCNKQIKKDTEQFVMDLNKITHDINIIGEYVSCKEKITCQCKICNHIWNPVAGSLLAGRGCPKCNTSIGEKTIRLFLEKNQLNYESQKTYVELKGINGKVLSYDFHLPTYNLLIEFQGEQHEHPVKHFGGEEKFKIQQEHDRRKQNYAKEHNINLLEIWYYDINNVESILTEYLNNLKLESVTTTGVA